MFAVVEKGLVVCLFGGCVLVDHVHSVAVQANDEACVKLPDNFELPEVLFSQIAGCIVSKLLLYLLF